MERNPQPQHPLVLLTSSCLIGEQVDWSELVAVGKLLVERVADLESDQLARS
jgi:hypothetical protein